MDMISKVSKSNKFQFNNPLNVSFANILYTNVVGCESFVELNCSISNRVALYEIKLEDSVGSCDSFLSGYLPLN